MKKLIFISLCIFLIAYIFIYGTKKETTLNLSRKGLTEIPDFVYDMKHLKVLKLYGNKIDSISPRIKELENLEELYLGKNKLKFLPNEIGHLKKLKILSIPYNDLAFLTDSINGLHGLEQLWLDQNKLHTLPKSIGKLTELQVLKLTFNELDSLPEEIGDCAKLGFVYLNRNNLKRLPQGFGKLKKLKELYLSNAGFLLDVPEVFCDLRMLELIEVDRSIQLPACLYVLQANRLRIVFN